MLEDTIKDLSQSINRLVTALERNAGACATPPCTTTVSVSTAETTTAPAPAPKVKKAAKSGHSEIAAPVVTEEPAPAPAPVVQEAAAPNPSIPQPVVTLEVLRSLAEKLLAAQRLSEIVAINKANGVRKITEAPQEKWLSLYNDLSKAVAALP
jgi:hypothetical protein